MKVIGAGFGRTGTLSLKGALETLGFGPCYHMSEVFSHPEHVPLWRQAGAGGRVDWRSMFAEYEATVDWPGAEFYAQYVELWPEAPVILNVRDPERWYESCRQTIYPTSAREAGADPPNRDAAMMDMINELIWEGRFGGRFRDRQYVLSVFERHIEEVRRRVPPERLLVYEVRQGWEPLCRFLGVEIPPNEPFPHTNTTEEWHAREAEEAKEVADNRQA